MEPLVSALFIYPVKSLAGIALTEATVEPRGLKHDRRWMIVDKDNFFFTQRDVPQMATIKTSITHNGQLVLSKGSDCIDVPAADGSPRSVNVWNDTVPGTPVSYQVDEWLSDHLSITCSLVYMAEDSLRPIDPDYAVGDEIVSFADGFPILLTNTASLRDLNVRTDDAIPMNRFRPNIVVDTDEAFMEDAIGSFRLGTALLEGVKPCARCSITTIDQETGGRMDKEPLKTLATFRRTDGKVNFGENLVVREPGLIRLGDAVDTLAPRGHFPRRIASAPSAI